MKFEAKFLKTGISTFMTKQSSHCSSLHLLSMWDCTCRKALWSSKSSFRVQLWTSQPCTSDTNYRERHVNLKLNLASTWISTSPFTCLCFTSYSRSAASRRPCAVPREGTCSAWPWADLTKLDNFAFKGATTLQQCRATGFKTVSMTCIECPAAILLQFNCFSTH